MRSALLLAAAVAACASPAPVTPVPCEPACAGGAVCIEGVCYSPADAGAEGGAVDAAADLETDAGAEAGADVQGLDGARADAAADLETDAADVGKGGLLCAPERADCDGDRSNGCETNTATSAAHCGRCGNACQPGNACTRAGCVPSAPPGCPRICARSADCGTCTGGGPWCCVGGMCRVGGC